MRSFPFLILSLATFLCQAQSISSINFKYWYNLEGEVKMELNPVKQKDSIVVFYTIHTNNPSLNSFTVEWEKKDSYNQRVGGIILPIDSVPLVNGVCEGKFRFTKPEKPFLLVAKLTNKVSSKSWIFFKQI